MSRERKRIANVRFYSGTAILSDFRKKMVDERAPVCYKNGMSIGALLLSERRATGGRDTKER